MKSILFSILAMVCIVSHGQASTFGSESQMVDMATWCARMKWDWSWDAVSGIGIARGPRGEWRFRDGGSFATQSGRLVEISIPAYRAGEKFMVPAGALPSREASEHQKTSFSKSFITSPTRRLLRVVVDAGHGGKDAGAISPFGTREKELALEMALAVRDELVRRGFEVRMTRESDTFVPLANRAKIANDWDADLFVSVHANASPARTLRGFEIYTLSEETDDILLARSRAETNKMLDVILWDLRGHENRRQAKRVAEHVSGRVDEYAAVEARRLKSANFHVLKNTKCPAILVEIGYLTNRRDHARLQSPRYRRSIVDGIVGGIWTFKSEYEATDGFARSS